ncbi:MAG: PAS domain S-box protein [Deltaproteobacteria bacterium]|nr:PAS domain S-box protein [Deltaproteobacteria bacterium]
MKNPFKRFVMAAGELPTDVQNERQIALIRILIATLGIVVALLWRGAGIEYMLRMQPIPGILFSVWTALNVGVAIFMTRPRLVKTVSLVTTLSDIFFVASLDLVILLFANFNFITGPQVALYFSIIAASSLRNNARIVRMTGILCALAHLTIVACCYFSFEIPGVFSVVNIKTLSLRWLCANDVLISLAMALFGYIVGSATIELIESENHYLALFNSIPDGIVIASSRMRILASNTTFQNMVGRNETELVGKPLQQFWAGKSSSYSLKMDTDSLPSSPFTRLYGKTGSIPVQVTQSPIEWNGQKCTELSIRNMSDRYELELTLARVQKVQTVGKLAGGLAHDFNNILSGIFGAVSLSKRVIQRVESPLAYQPITRYLETISDCGQTAASILDRLSSFSRTSIVETATIDILEILMDTVTIMGNTLPSNVEIQIKDTFSLPVKADKTSLTQALLNLCINAKDAIGNSPGKIILSASPVFRNSLPEKFNLDANTDYICIQVRDNGPGMDEQTMQKIFDPFFTTKSKDQGTGIGLSMVYNIAFVHGGAVDVESAPGKGSTFSLYIEAGRDSLLPIEQ